MRRKVANCEGKLFLVLLEGNGGKAEVGGSHGGSDGLGRVDMVVACEKNAVLPANSV